MRKEWLISFAILMLLQIVLLIAAVWLMTPDIKSNIVSVYVVLIVLIFGAGVKFIWSDKLVAFSVVTLCAFITLLVLTGLTISITDKVGKDPELIKRKKNSYNFAIFSVSVSATVLAVLGGMYISKKVKNKAPPSGKTEGKLVIIDDETPAPKRKEDKTPINEHELLIGDSTIEEEEEDDNVVVVRR